MTSWVYFAQPWMTLGDQQGRPVWPRVHAKVGGPFWGPSPIKIGVSRDLFRRLMTISGRVKQRVALLGLVPGGVGVEREMHRRFAHLRLKANPFGRLAGTEWFKPSWELETFIRALPRPPVGDLDYTRRPIAGRWCGQRFAALPTTTCARFVGYG